MQLVISTALSTGTRVTGTLASILGIHTVIISTSVAPHFTLVIVAVTVGDATMTEVGTMDDRTISAATATVVA